MTSLAPSPDSFTHEAFMYAGQDEFLAGTLTFVRGAVEAEEPILVVVSAAKIGALRSHLNGENDGVLFADMDEVGLNPARIIPAWRDFVSERFAPGRGMRGIGEPIFPARNSDELVECHRHEALLNLAFADTPGFRLLCPYDTEALEPNVVEHARHTHPFVVEDGTRRKSTDYAGIEAVAAPFDEPLPDPPADADELSFDVATLGLVRMFVGSHARDAGLAPDRIEDLLLAAHELASNSVRHGGGSGVLRVWLDPDSLVCEVSDRGWIDKPLVGRERPAIDENGGYGLWLVNQLCELVQVRSYPGGSIVRLHMRRGQA
jgi:anti-sigma regulatory factor (Ser/Thr protein kinase)